MNINDYDYQHSINGCNGFIENGFYKKEFRCQKNHKFVGYLLKSNEYISDSSYKINELYDKNYYNVEITLIYDESYIKNIVPVLMADVYYYPPCECCVEDDTIPISDIMYESELYETIEPGDRFEWNNGEIEIKRIYKQYSCFIPTIMTYFKVDERKSG